MRKNIALIPSYKPDDKLIKLVKELKKENIFVIIVDDGSGDEYRQIFEECKQYAHVISYGQNKGKGYALKTGMLYIKENYKEFIIVTMDSDGQHTVKDALKLFDYIKNNQEKLVLGKRIRSNKTPIKSRVGNEITRIIYKVTTGINIYDTQTGLRAFSDKLIDYMLEIKGDRYEYEMNVLLYLKKNNIKVKELEIETIYINNNNGSHFKGVKDSIKIYKQIIKYIFNK